MTDEASSRSSTVRWADVERKVGDIKLTPTQVLGYRLFTIVAILIGLLLLVFVGFCFLTWPRQGDIRAMLPPTASADDYAATVRVLRGDWQSDARDLAQLLVIGPFVPLLSAIIGYILGKNDVGGEEE